MLYEQTSGSLINFGASIDVTASVRHLTFGVIKKECEFFLRQYQTDILGLNAGEEWDRLIAIAHSIEPSARRPYQSCPTQAINVAECIKILSQPAPRYTRSNL